ncbi:MAG: MalY/PatB family protein [Arcobacter sp.]|uniref:MalY/PatB family protein n=1 Tax=Arcobacter sp. TaxID=1872629 RepID=UPI003B0087C0
MFDKIIDRKNSSCTKYDDLEHYFGKANLDPFWVADMDFEIPAFLQETIQKRASHNVYGYGKQNKEIFEAIKNWMKSQHSWDIDTSWISLCNGVVPAYAACIEAFSNIDDEVIVQTPVYFPLFQCIKTNNRKVLYNPLKENDGYYTMDLEHLKSIITPKTKILTLCSPHNPVGRIWSKGELEELANICMENNITIISDEIHADLVFKKFTPLASINKTISNCTVTLNSSGKTFNIAGLNASYCITSNNELKDKLDKVIKQRVINSINVFGLIAMQSAYENGTIWLNDLKDYIASNIDFTIEYLHNNSKIKVHKPEATYLLWLDFSEYDLSHNQIKEILLNECNVALNDGLTFGKNGKNYFRFNTATSKIQLKNGLNKIINIFK